MTKGLKIYEGKTKVLYETDSRDLLIQYFKDDATAFNARKKGTIRQKGIFNNKISSRVFEYLGKHGVPTHFVKRLNDREMLVKRVKIVPLEVVVRNVAAGSLCRMLNLPEGMKLKRPILELCYKDDALDDPIVNESHVAALGWAEEGDIALMKRYALKANELMRKFFLKVRLELVDFKLEFGRLGKKIILADEISPDTCRLWEVGTGTRFDKDRFRKDLGNVEEAYQEVLKRVSA